MEIFQSYFNIIWKNSYNSIRNWIALVDSLHSSIYFQVYPEERPTQAASQAMDSNGIMYFGMMNPPAIYCWNTATEFSQRNFHLLAIDEETLQFASGVKVVNNIRGEEELWVLTSSFQRVMTGTISSDRVNFRIHAETLSTLLQTSGCKAGKQKPWSSVWNHYFQFLVCKMFC